MAAAKALGKVVDIGYNGKLIIKSYGEINPEAMHILTDSTGKSIAKVTDIVGPVAAPYIIAIPYEGIRPRLLTLLGRDVYIGEAKRKRSGRYGRRRKKS